MKINYAQNWIYVLLGLLLSLLTFGFKGVFSICFCAGLCLVGALIALIKDGWSRSTLLEIEYKRFEYKGVSRGLPFTRSTKIDLRDVDKKIVGSPTIDSCLNDIVNFALRDFIEVWYSTLTNDSVFLRSLQLTANKTIGKLGTNLRKVEWIPFMTRHLVDDFASHIRLYRRAKEKLQEDAKKHKSNNTNVVDDLETHFFDLELEMEKKYCRDLVSTSPQYENAYLHDLADVFMYLLLPGDEFKCTPSRLLIREIFVKKIILPLIDRFSDPDYVYQTIIWFLSDIPLRYEDFLTIVESTDNTDELLAVQDAVDQEISVQRSKDTGGKDDISVKQQLSSLFYVRRLVSRKLHRMQEGIDEADAVSDDFRYSDSECGICYDLSLEFVLNNNLALSYFIDYLTTAGGTAFIDMFLNIAGFKASVDHMIECAKEEYGERAGLSKEQIDTAREAASNIFHQYLGEDIISKVALEENVVKKLQQNMKNKDQPETWFDETHLKLFEILEQDVRFFPSFKRSDLYVKLLAELKLFATDDCDNKSDEVEKAFAAEDALDCISLQSADSGGSYESSSIKSEKSENELYDLVPSYSAKINTIALGSEDNHSFALYNITVNKYNQKGEITATWNVLRRYSDFHALHVLIQQKFPSLRILSFPAKKAFNNLSRDLLEKRKKTLNQYIKILLLPETLRQNKGLEATMMDFLKMKDYGGENTSMSNKFTNFVNPIKTGVKSFGNAVISVPDVFLDGVGRVSDNLGKVTKSVLGEEISASNMFNANFVAAFMPDRWFENPLLKPFWKKLEPVDSLRAFQLVGSTNGLKQITVANTEGRVGAHLDAESSDNIPIRILLLFMDEVFGLRKRNQWFRRRLVAFLHQFIHAAFGSSINRKIFDFVMWLTSEGQVAEYLKAFKNSFWPNGVLADIPPPRPLNVQMRTRVVAKVKMLAVVPDELRLFIGNETTTQGISLVFEALLNPHLNQRFCYVLLERFLLTVFPKNKFNEIFPELHSKSPRCAASRFC